MRRIFSNVILLLLGVVLLFMVAEMPRFGQPGPAYNHVADKYLQDGVEDTGSTNTISAIILDYRAYDTLGEATVLFGGIAAVVAVLTAHNQRGE